MITLPGKNVDAIIESLRLYSGKAEAVGGEIVPLMPTGFLPNYAAGEIYVALRLYARATGEGHALTDNAGFLVDLPNRNSFSPDAAYYRGDTSGMRYLEGAPVFAVEVRSENDPGPAMEDAMAQKRRDYFVAGTEVVWDVDLENEDVVRKYTADASSPTVYRRGAVADAEPALPGWHMNVDDLFPV